MSWIGAGVMALGTVANMAGQITQGVVANREAKYNASMADLERQELQRQGDLAAGRLAVEGRAAMSKQRARLAASGVDIASPSALDLTMQTLSDNLADISAVRNQTTWRTFAKAEEAKLYRRTGKQSLLGGMLGGVNALARGAATLTIGGGLGAPRSQAGTPDFFQAYQNAPGQW